ncbi:MAG: 2,3-bisphosphoglycerate-dependent phosphoglycerate mutase [Chthoniobacterales bacterium]|nr:2,3-bisphosphoglycerate-dependent phosphoglycerate mutase [Chthoniobacterales bacterium]
MFTLVLLRHGQSQWNVEQRFTGWAEPDLSEKGVAEARVAGQILAKSGFDFDLCFSSLHTRALKTLDLTLERLDRLWLPVEKHWCLNERHYGALTALYHAEVAAQYGEEQVHLWRRSFDVAPPPVEPGSRWDLSGDRRYFGIAIPRGESLKDTIARVLPYWQERIALEVKAGRRILVCGHGNSLRGLVKHLFRIPDEEIAGFELPTGKPIICELDGDLVGTRRYLLEQ